MKRVIITLMAFLATLLVLTNCRVNANEEMVDHHTSENSLDWQGVYRGTIPCADCEGIEMKLILKSDSSYSKEMNYLGKGENRFFEEGRFEWDKSGRFIALYNSDNNPSMKIQVGERVLFLLDGDGKIVEGELEPLYRLYKNREDSRLEGREWQLVELGGKAIEQKEGRRVATLYFEMESGRFFGNNSCNNYFGSYEIEESEILTLSRAGATLMACPDAPYEASYMAMLQEVHSYSLEGENLYLYNGEKREIARFKL